MNGTDFIRPDWPAPPRVRALCTTRAGGVSRGGFASLNLGAHVADRPQDVAENRRRVVVEGALPAAPRWLDQVHGTQVASEPAAAAPVRADAAMSRESGCVLAILTADCLPLLMCSRSGDAVAAVHAGWRGLAAGVIENTLAALGGDAADILVWLGPAIGPAAFEVGEEVRDAFCVTDGAARAAFRDARLGHYYADLYALARRRLAAAGVRAVSGGDLCTYSDSERFFSYRREPRCGRMASLVWIDA